MTLTRLPNNVFPRPCKDCGETKQESDFTSFVQRDRRYWFGSCKTCESARTRKWHRANPKTYSELSLKAKQDMTRRSFDRKKQFIARGICGECGVNPRITRWHCGVCRDRHAGRGKRFRELLKDEVFAAYGGQKCSCECNCTVTEREFLTMDHIGGRVSHGHAKSITGSVLYRWLKKNKFPPGFRVLCMNCNFAIGHAGYCPKVKPRLTIAI